MIKKLSFALVGAICLLNCTAYAQIDASAPDTTFEPGFRYMYGSNSFAKMTYDKGEILYNAAGEALTEEGAYEELTAYGPDYIQTTGFDGLKGVITSSGEELVPADYDDVYVRGDWAVGFKYAEADEDDYDIDIESGDDTLYYIINEADVYSLKNGTCVESTDREGFSDFAEQDGALNIEDRNGDIRSYAADGTAQESDASYLEDFDWSYPAIDTYYDDDDEFMGIMDEDGTPLCDPVYTYIYVDPGVPYFEIEDEEGMFGLLAADGTEVIAPVFTEMLNIDYGVYERCGIFAGLNDYEDTATIIDTVNGTENTIDTSDYSDIYFDGYVLAAYSDDDTCTLIAPDGSEAVLPADLEWDSIGYGLYTAIDDDNECVAAADTTGEIVAKGGDILITPDGHLVVDTNDGLMVYKL